LIAILVFIITTQLVRNLPALLELALLQYLDLTPGTGYAITTIIRELLYDCLTRALNEGATITDEASALEYCGFHPALVEGRADNI
ncbi:2-C-methyl-D-erythritol 4-phosphate cytidylyltransferase, partial [Salmonella enterica subsp. enterica serovar Anatum]|nr:2-C-methyl-D-erythritol 4-phosphate cytidylyltransferase [Salmonella enterica subsp. enterica serovar Anatum]